MEKTDTDAVKRVLKRLFRTYGLPSKIKRDNGPPFNSTELEDWLITKWGVKLTHITPLNPTENGQVERCMQGINKIASIAKLTRSNFNEALSEYVASYNSWPHSVTKIPPAELMFGRPVRTLLPNLKLDAPCNNDEELRDRDVVAKFTRNTREDVRRKAGDTDIGVGDLVLMMQVKKDKADTTYKNALHRVINIEGNGRVSLMDMATNRMFERNIKHLKKYIERSGEQEGVANDADDLPLNERVDEGSNTNKEDDEEPIRKKRAVRIPERFRDFE